MNTLQLEGIWVEKGGTTLPLKDTSEMSPKLTPSSHQIPKQYKMLETITDKSGSRASNGGWKRFEPAREILGGVMRWEYLLGKCSLLIMSLLAWKTCT